MPTVRRARPTRLAVGVAAGALTLAIAACSSGAPTVRPTTTRKVITTTSTSTSTTTAPLGAGAATTTTTTPPDPNGPVVGAQGAELAPPAVVPAPVTVPTDCHRLAAPGVTIDCGRGAGGSAAVLWVVRHGPGAAAGADVYRVAGTQAVLVLTANDADGSSWSGVSAFTADIGGPDGLEVVFGYRLVGTGGQLHVDVVGGDAQLLFHRELDQGRVDTTGGVYRDWSAQFGPDDANCCPSVFSAATVDFVGGAWRVGHQADVPPAAVPAGQIP